MQTKETGETGRRRQRRRKTGIRVRRDQSPFSLRETVFAVRLLPEAMPDRADEGDVKQPTALIT
jgi:hypothetical protein